MTQIFYGRKALNNTLRERKGSRVAGEVQTSTLAKYIPGLTPADLKTIRANAQSGGLSRLMDLYETMALDPDIGNGIVSLTQGVLGYQAELIIPKNVIVNPQVRNFIQEQTIDRRYWIDFQTSILRALSFGFSISELHYISLGGRWIMDRWTEINQRNFRWDNSKPGEHLLWLGVASAQLPFWPWSELDPKIGGSPEQYVMAIYRQPGPQPWRWGLLARLDIAKCLKDMSRNDWAEFNERYKPILHEKLGPNGNMANAATGMDELKKTVGGGFLQTPYEGDANFIQPTNMTHLSYAAMQEECRRQIQITYKGSSLTTSADSAGGTRALGQVGQESGKSDVILPACRWLETYINNYIRTLVDLNFGIGTPVPYYWIKTESKSAAYVDLAVWQASVDRGVRINDHQWREQFNLPPSTSPPVELQALAGAGFNPFAAGGAAGGVPGALALDPALYPQAPLPPALAQAQMEAMLSKAVVPGPRKMAEDTRMPDELDEAEYRERYADRIEANPTVPWKGVAETGTVQTVAETLATRLQKRTIERALKIVQGTSSIDELNRAIRTGADFGFRRELGGPLFDAQKLIMARARKHIEQAIQAQTGQTITLSPGAGCLRVKTPDVMGEILRFLPIKAQQFWNTVAFRVAGIEERATLDQLRNLVEEYSTTAEGNYYFKNELERILRDKGLPALSDSHALTVYNTNIATSYNAERYSAMDQVKTILEYWTYYAVNGGTAEVCIDLHGNTYAAVNSIWQRIYPPNHYNCTGWVQAMVNGVESGPPSHSPQEGFGGLPGSGLVDAIGLQFDGMLLRKVQPNRPVILPTPDGLGLACTPAEAEKARELIPQTTEIWGWIKGNVNCIQALMGANGQSIITLNGQFDHLADPPDLSDGTQTWRKAA